MVKNSLKMFFTSFKYFWIPLVFLIVGTGIGFTIVYLGARTEIESLFNKIKEMVDGAGGSVNDLINYLIKEFEALPWTNFEDLMRVLFKENWLLSTIQNFFSTVVADYDSYKEAITEDITASLKAMQGFYAAFFISIGLGFFGGYFLTGSLIKKKWAKKSILRTIITLIVDIVLSAAFVALIGWLTSLWTPAVIISSLISIIVYSIIAVVKAYFAQRDESIKFKDVFTPKMLLLVLLITFIIALISVAMVIALFFILLPIPYKPITILIVLAAAYVVFIIASITINIVAEAEVYRMKKA